MKPVVCTLFSITIYFYDPRVQSLFFALLNSSMCAAMPQQQQMWWHRSGGQTKGCGCKEDRTEEKLPERNSELLKAEMELPIHRGRDRTVGFLLLSDGSKWRQME